MMEISAVGFNVEDDREFFLMLEELENASDEFDRLEILEEYGYGDALEFA